MTVINTRKKGGKTLQTNFHSESCESCLTVDAAAMIGCQPHCSRTSLHVTTSTNLLVRMPHLHFLSILFFFYLPPHRIYYPEFSFQVQSFCILQPLPSAWICGCVSSRKPPTWNLQPVKLFVFIVVIISSEGCRGRKTEDVKEGSRGANMDLTSIWCFCMRP